MHVVVGTATQQPAGSEREKGKSPLKSGGAHKKDGQDRAGHAPRCHVADMMWSLVRSRQAVQSEGLVDDVADKTHSTIATPTGYDRDNTARDAREFLPRCHVIHIYPSIKSCGLHTQC